MLAEKYPEKQLRIIHSKERLLDRYSNFVSETVHNRLTQRKVEVLLKKKVTDLQYQTILLDTQEEFHSDIIIISSGIAINDDSYRDHLKFQNSYRALE
jgi:NADH dehydrogenase FAD-containing subunit